MSDRKIKKCKECSHIYYEDEQHECPTQEYYDLRDSLIASAAEYEESKEFFE